MRGRYGDKPDLVATGANEFASDGPLAGLRVIEFVSIGPGPHCAMLLADLGAEVLRIDRDGGNGWPNPVVDRGRATLDIDLKSGEGREQCLEACDRADVVLEGFRPGVMERLGFGPDVLLSRNPRLIFARMTGWGQEGPLTQTAGHDINYIALTGALSAIGHPGERSVPPLNLVGDFGGGSLFLAFGVMAGLWERSRSGRGQVVDAAIVDGVSSLMSMFTGLLPAGRITLDRKANPLGGAAPFYRTYLCSGGEEIAVGAIEPKFWQEFVGIVTNDRTLSQAPMEWSRTAALLEQAFLTRTRTEWISLFEGTDACVTPVLSVQQAMTNDHLLARGTYVDHAGLVQNAPAPRFSRTPGAIQKTRDGREMLKDWLAATPLHWHPDVQLAGQEE